MHSQRMMLNDIFEPIKGGVHRLNLSPIEDIPKIKKVSKGRSVTNGEVAHELNPLKTCADPPQRLPLVLHMYNHKKASDNAAKRVHHKIERDKKKRALFKKVLFAQTSPRNPSPRKYPSPEWAGSSHFDTDNPGTEYESGQQCIDDVTTRRKESSADQMRRNSDASLNEIAKPKYDLRANQEDEHQSQNVHVRHAKKDIKDLSNDPSTDSMAIKSVSSSNRTSNIVPPTLPYTAIHTTPPKTTTLPPLHVSYSGYVLRNNKISLTRKYAPSAVSFSPTYHQRSTTLPTGKLRASRPSFLWAQMDAGTFSRAQH